MINLTLINTESIDPIGLRLFFQCALDGIAWRTVGQNPTQYITQHQYDNQPEKYQRFYEPFKVPFPILAPLPD